MFLGIEIGGTKLQLGLGPGNGTLASLWRGRVEPAAGGEGIRQQIVAAVPELLTGAGVERGALRGVGVGFGGPVDDATRTVIKSHQIAGWDGFPLAQWLSDMLALPVALGNDADVAGLAEAHFGAGKGLSPMFYITIGSGIGGGLIVNDAIYRGCGRGAAEIGHLRVVGWHANAAGEQVHSEAIVEHCASGWGIARRAQAALAQRGERRSVTAHELVEMAARGDALAQRCLLDAWDALAQGICHVLALLGPRRIVIGGGVSLIGETWLFAPLRRLVQERVFAPFADCYDIVPAALGEEVVVHGALALARRQLVR